MTGVTMHVLDRFNIDIFKLSDAVHDYQFEIGNSFFEAHEHSLVQKGSGEVKVVLEKTATFIKLYFDINMTVTLECDRSLEEFDYAINETEKLVMKFGETEEEVDESMVIIPRDTHRINVAQYIYEYIGLAIPMKKLHPKFGETSDEDEIVYSSDKGNEESSDTTKDKKDNVDPRWSALKNLK